MTTEIQRGSVWRIPTVGRERTVVVIENNSVIRLHPGGIICAVIQEAEDARDTLVTVPIVSPVVGVVMAPDIAGFRPQRFEQGKLEGYLTATDMERVDRAVRAVLDL
ncbi:type II toxin-antitoxin system PemK/MazF family toxin [Streptomyces sp. CL12-4]|uniref:type II toxin-antitoxin system PemK/MazF family toxin n=1 Tax=Streptomyces sp. CL12-4 TaxID=2810306 RepID=UPI001EFC1F50|nr:type II toxin-antitoxin system PemK/MazF family toxin [Streptomyces sp. CL12-4]MCG8971857.1 type II toxin-antitoxin system PemK/MazF family toxin [Streptomyces sp. CL12-4]